MDWQSNDDNSTFIEDPIITVVRGKPLPSPINFGGLIALWVVFLAFMITLTAIHYTHNNKKHQVKQEFNIDETPIEIDDDI